MKALVTSATESTTAKETHTRMLRLRSSSRPGSSRYLATFSITSLNTFRCSTMKLPPMTVTQGGGKPRRYHKNEDKITM
jgi:hypothetical protein